MAVAVIPFSSAMRAAIREGRRQHAEIDRRAGHREETAPDRRQSDTEEDGWAPPPPCPDGDSREG